MIYVLGCCWIPNQLSPRSKLPDCVVELQRILRCSTNQFFEIKYGTRCRTILKGRDNTGTYQQSCLQIYIFHCYRQLERHFAEQLSCVQRGRKRKLNVEFLVTQRKQDWRAWTLGLVWGVKVLLIPFYLAASIKYNLFLPARRASAYNVFQWFAEVVSHSRLSGTVYREFSSVRKTHHFVPVNFRNGMATKKRQKNVCWRRASHKWTQW